MVTLRDPAEQLVSVYHYRQQALGRDPFKPPDRLQADAFIRQTWSRYLLDWAPTGCARSSSSSVERDLCGWRRGLRLTGSVQTLDPRAQQSLFQLLLF